MNTLAATDSTVYFSFIGAPIASVLLLIGAWLLLRRWRGKGNDQNRRGPR